MKLAWHFSKVHPRFKNREATQGEFFASDTPLRSFVREAIQNSLDARRPDTTGPVSVRIFLSGQQHALSHEAAKRYFRDGWKHFRSESSGLRNVPQPEEPCQFVVYEDSGTTGLTGEVDQFHEINGQHNPFYYFFRAEGQSSKLEAGRGRWGLGKYVFPRSSRIRSFFALTVRCDDQRRLLVGQSILRSHQVDGKSFTPDGWFGRKPPRENAAPPVEDPEFLDCFESDFCLERKTEPGLSIVIPFCDAAWDATSVINCIMQDYFSAILFDDLVVTLESPEATCVIHSHSIVQVLQQCDQKVRQHVGPLLDLTAWSRLCRESNQLILWEQPCSSVESGKLTVSDDDGFNRVRSCLQESGRVGIRIPLTVHARNQSATPTFFDVFLQRSASVVHERPTFIREGIVISAVRARSIRRVNAIVQIDDPPLAALLGDAENPAHTEWNAESSHFKDKYQHGPAILRFVRNAVSDIWELLHDNTEADDTELLLDVFSIAAGKELGGLPVDFETRSSRMYSRLAARGPGDLNSEFEIRRRPYRISRRKGGFRISGRWTDEVRHQLEGATSIEVRMAYDRRCGNPLRKYSETDFRIDESPIQIDSRGATAVVCGPNRLCICPEGDDFEVLVSGFDINRDLYLRTRTGQRQDFGLYSL